MIVYEWGTNSHNDTHLDESLDGHFNNDMNQSRTHEWSYINEARTRTMIHTWMNLLMVTLTMIRISHELIWMRHELAQWYTPGWWGTKGCELTQYYTDIYHIQICQGTQIWTRHATDMNEPHHRYRWVVILCGWVTKACKLTQYYIDIYHIQINQVTQIWRHHATDMNEPRHRYRCLVILHGWVTKA